MTGIIDYDGGNIGSLISMLDTINEEYILTSDIDKLLDCSHIILPGVGSFDSVARNLRKKIDLDKLVYEVNKKGIPFLGICVGMQLLADYSTENGITNGLGVIEGKVEELNKYLSEDLKIPHVGWNNIFLMNKSDENFLSINGRDFYHIHSFFFNVKHKENIVASVQYGIDIPVIVKKNNFMGVQFHPEKSQDSGIEFFKKIFYSTC